MVLRQNGNQELHLYHATPPRHGTMTREEAHVMINSLLQHLLCERMG